MICCGISGSGKSTFVRDYIKKNPNTIAFSRDTYRMLLFGYSEESLSSYYEDDHLKRKEGLVSEHIHNGIRKAINDGYDVIADNTHLNKKYINEYKKYTVPLHLVQFNIDKSVCIERNKFRSKPVDVDIINKQYAQFKSLNFKEIKKDIKEYNEFLSSLANSAKKQENSLKKIDCYIFDIDGTLAHVVDRNPFDFSQVGSDRVDLIVAKMVEHIKKEDYIIICSGREDSCKEETEKWLEQHKIYYDDLYMRKSGDFRKDWMVKAEMWRDIQSKYNIMAMYDDRTQVVDFARKLGFKVFQVENHDF